MLPIRSLDWFAFKLVINEDVPLEPDLDKVSKNASH